MIRDLDGNEVMLGKTNDLNEGAVLAVNFAGADQLVDKDAFSGNNARKCQEVWGKLEIYESLSFEVRKFFTYGEVPIFWSTDGSGVVDLTDKLILTQARRINYE